MYEYPPHTTLFSASWIGDDATEAAKGYIKTEGYSAGNVKLIKNYSEQQTQVIKIKEI